LKAGASFCYVAACYGRFKLGSFFVSGQRAVFQGESLFPPYGVAQHVIVVANHAIAVAYSRDRCCQCHLKDIWQPDGNSAHRQYGGLCTVVGVSLKQRPKLYRF